MPKPSNNTLSGLVASQAMRRQIIRLPKETTISNSINALIKYKINALLTTDHDDRPIGVLSKTDIMGAYYAGIPIDTPVEDIMSAPPLFCHEEDALEKALERMRTKGIYRLYVMGPDDAQVVGALAYPDIVGLLYRYCHDCELSHIRLKRKEPHTDAFKRFIVNDVMTAEVKAVLNDVSILQVMEELSMHRFGAILVRDGAQTPCGVISKTDLTLAYKHGIDPQTPAESIMSSPVQSCGADDLLEDAIKQMILSDVQRLFVNRSHSSEIVGVFSLSDAARIRSGSCHACISSRITVES
ncbi:hypothetical protein D3OALGA1CA_950 [Olavius algarvensis associated proteobacterium Delta 3]|nr:hypothetical protein D3OALGA1CA_950 [Olavius algarvensis associated proteobacterium Delta 3]CAB5129718.1 hypothetical protein D3OALGB2SA_3537 [Olavius algarvensis associated proteobacterium Delta 3]